MRARAATAVVGIVGSLVVSAVVWWHFQTAVFFLFVPFVPFLFRRTKQQRPEETIRECPVCGFRPTDDSYAYCPRDGTPLE
ncbi:hypothetical protein [Halapricum desulfuricans]|uniref:hypothetical protein n=1 Tax=Halapricum desulfuricans TaxID=2841257 RepID=UPI001E3E707A|nr:hypothetical protein [Halapricum desulfuricans]